MLSDIFFAYFLQLTREQHLIIHTFVVMVSQVLNLNLIYEEGPDTCSGLRLS